MKKLMILFIILLFSVIPSLAFGKKSNEIFDNNLRQKFNIFLTNFSEVCLEPFEKGKIANSSLIKFGVWHNIINNSKLIEKDNGNYRINEKIVETTIFKYFGIENIKNQSITGIAYLDGYYEVKISKLSELVGISEVNNIYQIDKDVYKVVFCVYPAPYGTLDIQGFLGRINRDMMDYDCMTATIKEIQDDSKSRFILINYILVEKMIY